MQYLLCDNIRALTVSPGQFQVKVSGVYNNKNYYIFMFDDQVNLSNWISENQNLTLLDETTLKEWTILLYNPFQKISIAVQKYMDSKAQERNYDNILSACTYTNSTNTTFAAEGQACLNWRDAVWAKCYEIMFDVQSGIRPIPSEVEVISELPVFSWPT